MDYCTLPIAERAKLYIYAAPGPIRRLERDVKDIGRFEGPGGLTSCLRLVVASPPLSPASAGVLDAAIGVCGERLFSDPYIMLLDSMALVGPIAAAEAFVLLTADSSMTEELQSICTAFLAVFEQYPDFFLAEARAALAKHNFGKR
ncbi:hypothetical protein LMG29542_04517 [Paraburkholderia humisilvae]|uniref:Uncharacterized protein n=2 Tax=Paraburkholderia humisilvae TaxID=627669 RepID=A0A6J5EC23_9BURK|nr:hypothetical protein LMG29542_04517 [Paraburkholderia humisilvae]